MIARSTNAEFLNSVINHESVKPWVSLGFKQQWDTTTLLANPANIFMANEHGGFLLIANGDGLYELHTQFLPEGRGAQLLKDAREALEYFFTRTDGIAIRTFITDDNKAAKRMARWLKFIPVESGVMAGFSGVYYLLTIKQWVQEIRACQ
jgi:hypothetical protein